MSLERLTKKLKKLLKRPLLLFFGGLFLIFASFTITPTIGNESNLFIYHSVDFTVLILGFILVVLFALRKLKKRKLPSDFLSKLIIISATVWIISIIVFFVNLLPYSSPDQAEKPFSAFANIVEYASLGIGGLAFALLVLAILIKLLRKDNGLVVEKSLRGVLVFGLKLLALLAILPLFLLYRTIDLGTIIKKVRKEGLNFTHLKPKGIKSLIVRLALVFAICLTFLPLWAGGYIITGSLVASQLGYNTEPISIAGTGSMYPTFPKGQGKTPQELANEVVDTPGMFPYPNGLVLFGKRILGHQIGRKDIVVVEDDKTRKATQELYGDSSGWVKRVVAVGGDTLELRDGLVYLNNEPLKEPYIAKAHSTFGESFLKECSKVTIPENSVFIMGDNRTGSGDSREVGFFSITDIKYVLPLESQKGDLVKNWRDTSKDFDESSKIKLDKIRFLELLNEKRKEAGIRLLKYQSKLEKSAYKRGGVILKYDDFSYEATKSGYTQTKAMNEVDYSNIVWNEGIVQGYYEAEELIEYFFEFPDWKKFMLDKDMQEVGIAEAEGTLNGCSAQVIVQHFAGYVPPNYKKEDIESWRQTVSNLNDIIPSWEAVKGQNWINQNDLKKLLDLFYRERTIASNVLSKMEANQWLTRDEENSIKEYDRLSTESMELARKLNSQ